MMNKVEEKLKLLPECPGVYLMKDAGGGVIYVGKAASLRKRVRSYFNLPGDAGPKALALAGNIDDFEYIAAGTEVEALILECSLIKKHRPKYNVRFMDDKKYPYIKISGDEYPGVYLTRKLKKDGSNYYGPYTDAAAARKTVKILREMFLLRTCGGRMKKTSRPCLYCHISQCSGPCAGKISAVEYNKAADRAKLFLSGRSRELILRCREEMAAASRDLDFERAAFFRDRIASLESVSEKQNMEIAGGGEEDYISYVREEGRLCAGVLSVREGRVVRFEHFLLEPLGGADGPEILSAFIKQRYTVPGGSPSSLVLPEFPEDREVIEEWLRSGRGGKVIIFVPRRGRRRALLDKLQKNLAMKLTESGALEQKRRRRAALEELAGLAGTGSPPEVIECFDAAHMSGSNAVGAVAVFRNGFPHRPAYRRFRIRDPRSADDVSMIEEIARRRYARALREGSGLPQLIVVDGGRGQVAAVLRGLSASGLSCPVLGFAKRFELIYPARGGVVQLARDSRAFDLLRHLRDEAHRAATSYHASRRVGDARLSMLDRVSGLGENKKLLLMREFGDMRRIAGATESELQRVKGIGPALSRRIRQVLKDD